MKITKAYLGKYVELTWKDPNSKQARVEMVPRGRSALATWVERGVIEDISDGVIRVVHSSGKDPGATEVDEIQYTVVFEDLVEQVTVFEPVKSDGPTPS